MLAAIVLIINGVIPSFPKQERLRLKIIERLLKEGSSAEEPLNIPLSDYSSDEGDTSISSENEGKNSLRLSDLEGPCCAPTKAPPSSPEVTTELRKFRINRMRKIMFELDRLYFQPLLHLRFRNALRKRARRKRPAKAIHPSATRLEGGEDGNAEATETQSSPSEPSEPEVNEEMTMSTLAETLMGLNAEALGMKVSCPTVKAAKGEVRPQPSNTSMKCSSTETITPATLSKKSSTGRRKRKVRKAAGNEEEEKSNKKRVSRALRLFLAARKIIIYRRPKQRKFRVRSKSSQSKRNRTPIDLPTTDPGSDLHFSTDDEMPLDTVHSMYSTVPRTRRILLQSELQRRYIEEIGDGLETKFMPPELIITTPNKAVSQRHRPPPQIRFTLQPPPQTAPQQAKETLMEFPMIGNPTPRRTNSWHNLHTKSTKSKMQSPYQWLESHNQEELAMKLSLKKKIWTGVHPDNGGGMGVDRSRPLSWLMPPQMAEQQQHSASVRTTCYVKRERTTASSAHVTHGRDPALDLFNACSQKLMAWQKEMPLSPRDHLILDLPTPEREMGSGARSSTSKQGVHLKKKNADKLPHRQLPLDHNNGADTLPAKLKRKKNPLTKIAETTQILTRLAKTTSSSMHRQTKSGVSVAPPHIRSATAGYTLGYNNNNNKLPNAPSQSATTNKFKTGGIVATAVQPSTKRRKKLRSLATKKQDTGQLPTVAAPLKASNAKASLGATTTANALQLKGAVSSSSFMRKVKSKIKRKKSNPAAALNEGGGGGGAGGGLVASHDLRRNSTTTTTMTIEMMTRKMKELPYM